MHVCQIKSSALTISIFVTIKSMLRYSIWQTKLGITQRKIYKMQDQKNTEEKDAHKNTRQEHRMENQPYKN